MGYLSKWGLVITGYWLLRVGMKYPIGVGEEDC